VTPGKRADLVAVEGNPLQNITVLQNVQRIKLVLKGGDVCVDRRVA
jgi:imidazolonepropionase-like amidohydrolase